MTSHPCEKDSDEDIRKVFMQVANTNSDESSDFITVQDLMKLAEDHNDNLSEYEAQLILKRVDPGNGGEKMSLTKFLKFNQRINFHDFEEEN